MMGPIESDAELEGVLAGVQDSVIRPFGLYWLSKKKAERLPGRADIDPQELRKLLPYLYLIDVERATDVLRYRFRLIGTKVAEWAGRDATGMYLDSGEYGAHGAAIAEEDRTVVERARPRYDERHAAWPNHEHKFYRRLVVPLASDGVTVNMLAGVLSVAPPPKPLREPSRIGGRPSSKTH